MLVAEVNLENISAYAGDIGQTHVYFARSTWIVQFELDENTNVRCYGFKKPICIAHN